ncbi:DUF1330 domain-containing protein [Streptomyces sp. NPDC050738]|uniref:DUF1330 domain-containing protein n=1 Tax=Streptomyces sp. NPDC050738 TaxID=3154744 RepID=UPI00342E14E8
MKAYVIARAAQVTPDPEIGEYMRRIDATLASFEGKSLAHMGAVEVVEGAWPTGIIVIEFPSPEMARAWYKSPEYQEIIPLRTRHIEMDLIIADGVEEPYSAAETADRLGF